MSEIVILLQSIVKSIESDDSNDIILKLASLPIAILPRSNLDTMIAYLLNNCCTHKATSSTNAIINTFEDQRCGQDPLPIITLLFLNAEIEKETLEFVVSTCTWKQDIDYYVDLINSRDDNLALKCATILRTFFPKTNLETWQQLENLAQPEEDEESESDEDYKSLLHNFFIAHVQELSIDNKRPPWVKEFPQQPLDDVPFKLPTVHEAVTLLMSDIKSRKLQFTIEGKEFDSKDEDSLKEYLIAQYAISTISEKILLLEPVLKLPMFDDAPLFREFGPVNTMYTFSSADTSHVCSKHGGCRMFTCTEFEDNADDEYETDIMDQNDYIAQDWYTSFCCHCDKKINNRYDAIRVPLKHGGFKGCLHPECIEEFVEDPSVLVMIYRMKAQLNTIGIRAREK
jgi:hypothetical protein